MVPSGRHSRAQIRGRGTIRAQRLGPAWHSVPEVRSGMAPAPSPAGAGEGWGEGQIPEIALSPALSQGEREQAGAGAITPSWLPCPSTYSLRGRSSGNV